VPIRGTINGFTFRSSLMPMGGCHMMPVNQALCRGAGAQPGDIVDVVMECDDEVRDVEPPPEFKKELAKNKKAQERWEKLAFTQKKEMATFASADTWMNLAFVAMAERQAAQRPTQRPQQQECQANKEQKKNQHHEQAGGRSHEIHGALSLRIGIANRRLLNRV